MVAAALVPEHLGLGHPPHAVNNCEARTSPSFTPCIPLPASILTTQYHDRHQTLPSRTPIVTRYQRSTNATAHIVPVRVLGTRTQKKQTSPQQSQKEIREKKKILQEDPDHPTALRKQIRPSLSRSRRIRCTKAIQLAEQTQPIRQKGKERKGKNKERLFYQRRCDVGSAFLYPFYKWTGMVSYACLRVGKLGREGGSPWDRLLVSRKLGLSVRRGGDLQFHNLFPGMMTMNRCVTLTLLTSTIIPADRHRV